MAVPYTFGSATSSIPLSQLDSNFATGITLGNTTVYLGNTTTSFGNVTLTNVTISSVSTAITPAQGGTGLITIPANNVILGNGTSNVAVVAPGTSGNVLTSNGTTWSSATISAASVSAAGSTTQVQYNNAGAFAGSANLTFNGTTLTAAGLAGPFNGTVGATTANTGAFTTLSASSTVSGTGFSTYLASPPAIGGTAAAAGAFTTLSASSTATLSGLTASTALALDASKNIVSVTNTGSGSNVLATSPTLVTPILGTPTSGLLTNCTGLPNAGLVNSSITIGGTAIALGASSNALANDITVNTVTIGRGAGNVSTSTALGFQAALLSTTSNSVSVGYQAHYRNLSGNNCTAVGHQALYGGASADADGCVAIGHLALTSVTLGDFNTAVGMESLKATTSGGNNVAVGYGSLIANTTASSNTAVGFQAGYTNSTSANNAYFGFQAGYLSTGGNNTFIGLQSGYSSTGGTNTFIGYGAGGSMTTGAKNTILGNFSGNQGGLDIRTASNYIVLSDGDGNPRVITDSTGSVGIGVAPDTNFYLTVQSTSDDTKNAIKVNQASTGTRTQISFNNPNGMVGSISTNGSVTSYNITSDQRLKENIQDADSASNLIDSLQVRKFDWKADGNHQRYGFVAQELVTVAPEAVHQPTDTEQMMAVDYSKLVPMLVKEVQSLRKRLADAGL
jgi:hypothetical protein